MKSRRPTYWLILVFLFLAQIPGRAQEEIVSIERAPFSSRAYDEYSPALYRGSIVYTANKRITYTSKRTDATGKTATNLFVVQQEDGEDWTEPHLFSNTLSSVAAHYGWATYNRSGDMVFFNRNLGRISDQDARQGIFTARYENGEWTDIQPFPYNDPSYNLFHPFLSPDGTMLFFSSNMPGGNGGYDLYVSMLENGAWSEPVNLGSDVNTRRNEIYPVYHGNGRLYFSSNEHPGVGGYDIFFTVNVDGRWIAPVHLPVPYNSQRNDACFIALDTSYTRGYITSNRDRARTNSIYEFKVNIPGTLFSDCRPQEQNNYCYTIYEPGTMDIDTTNFMYEWLIEGKRYRMKEVDYCFGGPGHYHIQLNVVDMLSGEVLYNQAEHDLDIEDIQQAYITSPDTILVNESVMLDGSETFVKDFEIGHYIWSTGDLSYDAGSEITHAYYRPGVYTVRLGVTSDAEDPEAIQHTCSFKKLVVLPRGQDTLSAGE